MLVELVKNPSKYNINKIYSNKRMAPNKWKILTPHKFFYTSNYSLPQHRDCSDNDRIHKTQDWS